MTVFLQMYAVIYVHDFPTSQSQLISNTVQKVIFVTMASIYLNNVGASLVSESKTCTSANPITHLQRALLELPQQSQHCCQEDNKPSPRGCDEQFLKSMIEQEYAAWSSSNNPSPYDDGMNECSNPLFLRSSCLHSRITIQSTILFNLGLAYCSIRNYDEGILYLEKSLSVALQVPSILASPSEERYQYLILHNIGRLHFLAGRYPAAIEAYSRALTETHVEASHNHPFLHAAALNCIAVCGLYSHGDTSEPSCLDQEPLLLLCQALCIHDTPAISSSDSSDNSTAGSRRSIALAKATIINNTGRALFELEDFSGALFMYTQACTIRKYLLGNKHVDVAVSFCSMADAQRCLGNDLEAISGYETFISIASVKLGFDHPDVASVLATVGLLHCKLNYCHRAMHYLSRAL